MRTNHTIGQRSTALVAGVLLAAAGATALGGAAHAEEEAISQEEMEVVEKSAWGTFTWSAPVEAYAEIPLQLVMGFPMTESQLFTPGPKCETRSAGAWFSYPLEEGLIPGMVPGSDTSADNPKSSYANPTLARAANPPYEGTYGDAPVKKEIALGGNREAGPLFQSECPNGMHAVGYARRNGFTVGDLKVGESVATTEQKFVAAERVVESHSTNSLVDVDAGAVRIQKIGSILDIKHPVNGEPVITYRFHISGVSDPEGTPILVGDNGLTLAGQNVPASEALAQFNEQMEAHEETFEALGRHGVSIMSLRAFKDAFDYHNVEAPTVDLGYGFTARKNATLQFQALRLGMARYRGVHRSTDNAIGSGM